MLTYPNIDPVAFSLGPVDIRWYGISYVVGILLAWLYSRHMVRRYPESMPIKDIDDFLVWATIGVVAGGRLGEVLFYMPAEKLTRFWEIFYIWQPGMSFHGGLIGVALATFFFCRSRKIPFLLLADIVASAAPIGLFFGRLANFINAELYGRFTDVSWGMVFPGGGPMPRHPSQLYEAFLEGFLLFFGLMAVERLTNVRREKPGFIFGLFLMGYGLARFIVEFYREPDEYQGFVFLWVTMGQLLSVPVLLAGVLFVVYSIQHKKA
jgi:phosphatidylglycerol:prolipoprotein diacylglycerol transferase